MSVKSAFGASSRVLALAAIAVTGATLAGCTTVEGTNAFTDFETFEREVMIETVAGIGLVDREEKELENAPRAPLVMPTDSNLPAPQQSQRDQLPEDADAATIDVDSISEEDMRRIRRARVIDPSSASGRPLTENEIRQLISQMQRGGFTAVTGSRSLYLPPEEYFTIVNNQDLICLAADGSLVPLNDPACPPEVAALLQGTL